MYTFTDTVHLLLTGRGGEKDEIKTSICYLEFRERTKRETKQTNEKKSKRSLTNLSSTVNACGSWGTAHTHTRRTELERATKMSETGLRGGSRQSSTLPAK